MKLFFFALIFVTVFCDLVDQGITYQETRALGDIPAKSFQKIKVYKGSKFTIELPYTYILEDRWVAHKILGGWSLKCDFKTEPLFPKEKVVAGAKLGQQEQAASLVGPMKQSFSCVAIHPGVAMLTLWYRTLGVNKPKKVYKVGIKINWCKTPKLRKHKFAGVKRN